MKLPAVILTALFGCGATSKVHTGTPVEKVVKLLTNLQETLNKDEEREQKTYDKYACWCQKTSKSKADSIVQAQNDIRTYGQRILKLKGQTASLVSEIKDISDELSANEESKEQATAMRQKENGNYMAESAETKESMASLEEAIKLIFAGQSGKSALLQSSQQQSRNAVAKILQKLPSNVDQIPAKHLTLLSDFAKAESTYAPQSVTIHGILSDMYSTFAANLQAMTSLEASNNKNFEEYMAVRDEETKVMKNTMHEKKREKAEAAAMLADTTTAYDDTQEQMKADTEFFDNTKAACESKHEEWLARQDMRADELSGVRDALKILTADSAREQFAKTMSADAVGFLQIRSTPSLIQDGGKAAVVSAYNMLKAQATKMHSIRLAALAAQVRTAQSGHFDEVIGSIDKLMETLKEEDAADQKKSDECKKEYAEIAKQTAKLDWKIEKNQAKIGKLQSLIDLRTEEKDNTAASIAQAKATIKAMSDERKEEHDTFLQTKEDNEASIKLLVSAKDALSKYYKSDAFLQKVSKSRAPDAKFSDEGSHKNESNAIITLLGHLVENLNKQIAAGKANEAQAVIDYEKENAAAEKMVKDLTAKKDTLEDILATRVEDKTTESQDMKANNGERDEQLAWKAKLTPDCDFILKNFNDRASARSLEMEGLRQTKAFLAGKMSLLSEKFNDDKFPSLGFLGIH